MWTKLTGLRNMAVTSMWKTSPAAQFQIKVWTSEGEYDDEMSDDSRTIQFWN